VADFGQSVPYETTAVDVSSGSLSCLLIVVIFFYGGRVILETDDERPCLDGAGSEIQSHLLIDQRYLTLAKDRKRLKVEYGAELWLAAIVRVGRGRGFLEICLLGYWHLVVKNHIIWSSATCLSKSSSQSVSFSACTKLDTLPFGSGV
jgi:hypothetical protein